MTESDLKNKVQAQVFSLDNLEVKVEGGLRTKGYFKCGEANNPLVSIITVVLNGEEFLEESMLSVINQTYANIEYIVIDGASTDSTLTIIKKHEKQIDYWLSEKDKGIYDAWNKGVKASSGEWVAFLGADDFYLTDAVEKYVSHIREMKETIDYISSKVELITKEKKKIKNMGEPWRWASFKKNMNVAHVGSLHNRLFFKEVGLYDTTYTIAADYEILLRKRDGLRARYMGDITAKMRDGGVSKRMISLVYKETMKAKINSGHRNIFFAKIEYYLSHLKYFVKRCVHYFSASC